VFFKWVLSASSNPSFLPHPGKYAMLATILYRASRHSLLCHFSSTAGTPIYNFHFTTASKMSLNEQERELSLFSSHPRMTT